MRKSPQKYLYDIVDVGTRLMYLMKDVSLEEYADDIEIQESVERKIEKIAEASYKLRTKFDIVLSLAEKIYNFRGSIAHQYEEIKAETIYKFATFYVPEIVDEARGLMQE